MYSCLVLARKRGAHGAVVDVQIGLVPVKVIVDLLQHVDDQHAGEREHRGEPVRGRQARDELDKGVGGLVSKGVFSLRS